MVRLLGDTAKSRRIDYMNFKKKVSNLFGLVLTGGKSTRMKKDKAVLEFHGTTQSAYCFELLSKFCERVFISARREQAGTEGRRGYPQILDREEFGDIGPAAGILSAMTECPAADWLVLACDLPFVNAESLEHLIRNRDPQKIATAFLSEKDRLPEPLCAIYEARARAVLESFCQKGTHCPRKILLNSDAALIPQPAPFTMENVNFPEEFKEALKKCRT